MLAVLRSSGVGELGPVDALTLETEGSMSALSNIKGQGSDTTLVNVSGVP